MSVVTGVIRSTGAAGTAPKQGRSKTFLAGRAMLWTALMIVGAATLIPIGGFAAREFETFTLVQANTAGIQKALSRNWPQGTSAAWLETASELGLQLEKPTIEPSLAAAKRSVEADSTRASAWAKLAYLEYSKAGKVTPETIDALSKSMDACPFCDQDLIRWRFNFVLANWSVMPEAVRLKAFEQADILRWAGDNAEFLTEMKVASRQAGIPFGALQSAVNTPWRSWDLEPLPATASPQTQESGG